MRNVVSAVYFDDLEGSSPVSKMFTVIYRWKVKPGSEKAFIAAWHSVTESIFRTRGSCGSRLHREPDGIFCAIALWPSEEAWKSAEPLQADDSEINALTDSIQERLPIRTMECVDDLWRLDTET